MGARDELFEIVMRDGASSGGDAAWTNDLLDAFTKEVRQRIADELDYSGRCSAATFVRMDGEEEEE